MRAPATVVAVLFAWVSLSSSRVAAQPAAPPPADAALATVKALVPGADVELRREGPIAVFTIRGPAPDWAGLRKLAEDAHDRIALDEAVAEADGGPEARTEVVELWFADAGVVGRALDEPGPVFHVEVGDGDTMLDSRAPYRLAARAAIKVTTSRWGIQLQIEGRPTCAGAVENQWPEAAEVTVRCRVYGNRVSPLGIAQPRAVIIDEAHALGPVAQGTPRTFTFKLPKVKGSELDTGQAAVQSFAAEVSFEISGARVPHLDLARFDRATDWLRIMDALRADGVTLHGYRPLLDPAIRAMFDQLELAAPDDLARRPAAERKKLAKRWWKLIRDHHKRFDRPLPGKGILVRSGAVSAELRAGGFSKFD